MPRARLSPLCLYVKHLLELPHHIIRQRHRSEPLQRLHINFLRQRQPITNQFLQDLEIPHEKPWCDGIDEDSLFVERIAELMWQADWNSDEIANAGVKSATAREWKRTFPFWECMSI